MLACLCRLPGTPPPAPLRPLAPCPTLPCAARPARSTNHLGHFLLVNLLLEDLKGAPKNNPAGAPRCIIVGSITGNTNTLAGNVPPKVGAARVQPTRRAAPRGGAARSRPTAPRPAAGRRPTWATCAA